MNLKAAVKAALTVAVVGAVPAIAFGQATTPNQSTGSSLIIEVWDPATDVGLVQWLSNTYSTFIPGGSDGSTNPAGFTLATQLDGSSSAFQNLFNAATNTHLGGTTPATLDWMVLAGAFPASSGQNAELTTGPLTTTSRTNTAVNSVLGTFNTQMGALFNAGPSQCTVNPCIAMGGTDQPTTFLKNVNTLSYPTGLGTVSNTSGSVSAALGFWEFMANTAGATKPSTATQFSNASGNGQWTLSQSGDLVYSIAGATSTVPLPAAAWLFGSGLLGLLGVGRRRFARA
jgi:hypothetical protein